MAAIKRHPAGLSGLGEMYLHGAAVPQDFHKAAEYFTEASRKGFSEALFNLGTMRFRTLTAENL